MSPGPAGLEQLQQLFTRIINISVYLAFMTLTVMLFWGGIKFIWSGGDKKSLQAAWGTITWAILGILFLAIAWLVLVLVSIITGIDVTKVCFKFDGCP